MSCERLHGIVLPGWRVAQRKQQQVAANRCFTTAPWTASLGTDNGLAQGHADVILFFWWTFICPFQ